jgi:hypothetical protein
MWERKEDVFLLRLKALYTLSLLRPAPFATCREAANHKAAAVFSTVAQSTIGVRRRLAIAPLLKPLLNGVKVIEWSWISRIRMTFGSSFENHGPALSVTPRRESLAHVVGHALADLLVLFLARDVEINFIKIKRHSFFL